MPTILLRQANVVFDPSAIIKNAPLSNEEVDNNFANLNISIGVLPNLTTTNKANLVVAINELVANVVPTNRIADNAVTTAKIAENAITTERLSNYSVTSVKMSNTGVTANTYGGQSVIPILTVDGAGRVTTASNTTIVTGATLTVDNTTNFDYVLGMANATTGAWTTAYISNTKLVFNPSTGRLAATSFTGSGSSITAINADNISAGTLPLARGGTGATSAPSTRASLGLGTIATRNTIVSANFTSSVVLTISDSSGNVLKTLFGSAT